MFSKFELTNDGVNLLNRVIAEKKILKFTKFQLGKGDYVGDKKELSQLVDKFDEFNITQTNVLADGITNIRGFYDNRNLSIASKLTEIGIMAQLGDDSLTEVLFSYSNQPSADAETVPAKESYFSRTFSVMNKTDNVTSVTFDLTIRQDKYNFGTLEEMKSADYLDVGDKVTLWGETELGDTPFRMYIITDEVQDIQLINTLYAKEYFAVTNDLQNVNKNSVLNAEIVKKLAESNQGLKFDTILNIDDVGTKQEGYCYMFDGDIYKCIKQTEVTTPESANFQPISNNKLSDRLDNLVKCRVLYDNSQLVQLSQIPLSDDIRDYDYVCITWGNGISRKFRIDMTQFLMLTSDIYFSDANEEQGVNEYSFLFHNNLSGTANCFFATDGRSLRIPSYRSTDSCIIKITGVKF